MSLTLERNMMEVEEMIWFDMKICSDLLVMIVFHEK